MQDLVFVIVPLAFALLIVRMLIAQYRFIGAYRRRHVDDLRVSSDRGDRLLADPHWWGDSSFALNRRLWRLTWSVQHDADLERLRKTAVRRWLLALPLSVLVGAVWLVFASIVG